MFLRARRPRVRRTAGQRDACKNWAQGKRRTTQDSRPPGKTGAQEPRRTARNWGAGERKTEQDSRTPVKRVAREKAGQRDDCKNWAQDKRRTAQDSRMPGETGAKEPRRTVQDSKNLGRRKAQDGAGQQSGRGISLPWVPRCGFLNWEGRTRGDSGS